MPAKQGLAPEIGQLLLVAQELLADRVPVHGILQVDDANHSPSEPASA